MVAHQTIGIDMTSGLKGLTLCVNIRLRLPTKDVEETYVVLIVLKHLLLVHASKYGVINVSRLYRSSLPLHNVFMLLNQCTCPSDPSLPLGKIQPLE